MFRLTCCSIILVALQQSNFAAEPSALPPIGDPALVGIYRITAAEGPQAPSNWRGFAAITRSCGLISNHDGTAPLPFKLRTAIQNGKKMIDITVSGDTEKNTIYGTYEISGDMVRICLATEDVIATHGRPSSFDAANSKLVSKLTLKRIPQDETNKGTSPSAKNSAKR
jgi:hypothetical protein